MTPKEIHAACLELAKKVGPDAYVGFAICQHGVSASLHTKGLCGKREDVASFTVYVAGVSDFADALRELERDWLAKRESRNERIVEKMALEIIRLTAEFGSCTDAALRAEFSAEQVERLGALALSKANGMAANGPFEIVELSRSNAA